jgi:hypothetical protein
MPVNGFNIGRDVTVDINTPQGLLRATIRTGFSSKQETSQLQVKPMNGPNLFAEIPEGWSGTLEFDRGDDLLDAYFAAREADYFAGLNQAPTTITESITNPDGSPSQYSYTGVVLKFEDAGNKQSDQTVKQRVSWRAARRIKVI